MTTLIDVALLQPTNRWRCYFSPKTAEQMSVSVYFVLKNKGKWKQKIYVRLIARLGLDIVEINRFPVPRASKIYIYLVGINFGELRCCLRCFQLDFVMPLYSRQILCTKERYS